jgi:hypothetical protein
VLVGGMPASTCSANGGKAPDYMGTSATGSQSAPSSETPAD